MKQMLKKIQEYLQLFGLVTFADFGLFKFLPPCSARKFKIKHTKKNSLLRPNVFTDNSLLLSSVLNT